ncbi:efflux RND transporter periplasmic adaptor subunit [Neptunitalea lumnitzerae]|uniref:RND transporter n=1 Tax=Neptunitalea lumnitzerae TaxID=2965509 RepID=A0ABQ5MGX2_9FLAO|nr:efflux RND transporter periplasmic adaptor subunit [Neptunitalea sp. Y10]GLB48632.1 RND transporter [Neptunitalea sp. Y10]
MKQIITFIAILAVAQFTVSCGGEEKKPTAKEIAPINVTVSETTSQNESPYLMASGTIEAEQSAELSTRMMGYVTNVKVKVGDKVNKGQLLVAINSSDLTAKKAQAEAGVLQAQAAYNNAAKDYERFKTLFAQNSASQKELDDMTSRYQMAKAGLEAAEQMKKEVMAQFTYTNITAPFTGVVTNKYVKVGDMANPGMPLVSVESPSKLQVAAMVPESQIDEVKTGMEVSVFVKSVEATVTGVVSEVSMSAKNTGGQYMVKVDLKEVPETIFSGMYVNVKFPIASKEKANTTVFIPKEAIVTNGQLSGVYTVSSQQTAVLRWLRLGETFGDKVEVLSGLSVDEAYIIKAEGKLYNGAKVSIQ